MVVATLLELVGVVLVAASAGMFDPRLAIAVVGVYLVYAARSAG